jgi:hypothetical protein
MTEPSTISVIAVEQVIPSRPIDGERSGRDIGGGYGKPEETQNFVRKRVTLDAVALKTQMNGLLQVVDDLFEQADQTTGMTLTEVELSVEINAEGQVSLVGTGGKLANTGGITLKFTRP